MALEYITANSTMELSDIKDKWFLHEKYDVWCLEDVIYTPTPASPAFQRLSIFVPKAFMSAPGVIDRTTVIGGYTADTVPVVFENNSAGYMQMPHTWLGGPRCYAEPYLEHGFVYVTCGCRGHETKSEDGSFCGRSPYALVDLKMAIRFLRHNAGSLPGDMSKIISVGWSAGGAMSTLVGVTGNSENYTELLRESGAFMDERDDVFAAQIYCPIIDLEHADLAYEWMFHEDKEYEANLTAPDGGRLTPFEDALSSELKKKYIEYVNAMGLDSCSLGADGRSGRLYDYIMGKLNDSASKYLKKLSAGELPERFTVQDYLSGSYTYMTKGKPPRREDNAASHHAGAEVKLTGGANLTLGERMLRPLKPQAGGNGFAPPMVEVQGKDKSSWLKWDGERAEISSLDEYILSHRRRMKQCPSFDVLTGDSPENREMAGAHKTSTHFNPYTAGIIEGLKDQFPEEYERYYSACSEALNDEELSRRVYLINPMNYIGTGEKTDLAEHFRIRVGAFDADTSFAISAVLALRLQDAGKDTDYELVWDQPHSEADYKGEVIDWIDSITR